MTVVPTLIYTILCNAFLLFTLVACKTTNSDPSRVRVIGGHEIAEQRWPSVRKMKVYVKEESGAFSMRSDCTMTFIKSNIALTAAHCLCRGQRFVYSEKERWEDFTATKSLVHPLYRCDSRTPNSYDVGLLWFDEKVTMPTLDIIRAGSDESLDRLKLIGYGKTILKITGSFWAGSRKPIAESERPSPRKGETEFDGKHEGDASWRGERPSDPGFLRLSAVYDVKEEIKEPMTEASSAEGDSGGPALTMTNHEIVGVISRGAMTFTGVGSQRVEVVTELIDLRRKEIRDFLIENGAVAQKAKLNPMGE